MTQGDDINLASQFFDIDCPISYTVGHPTAFKACESDKGLDDIMFFLLLAFFNFFFQYLYVLQEK